MISQIEYSKANGHAFGSTHTPVGIVFQEKRVVIKRVYVSET